MNFITKYSGIHIGFVLLLNLAVLTVYSQETKIILTDKQRNQVVSDVYFQYDGQSGFSDSNGIILITQKEGLPLYLSHVAYGKLAVSPERVKQAAVDGYLQIEEEENHLLPVTFVQVRPPGEAIPDKMDFTAQNMLSHDAGALIESVPSISTIRKSGAYGFDPVLRGFKYDQLNLVLDGVQTATAACPNRMDPAASQIPINMIDQAEVLKGPHNLRYGNVFGGTINFKSTEPQFKEKTTPVGRFGTSYESNGNIFRTEGVAGVSAAAIDFRMFGAYSKGEDYKDGDGVVIPARFNRLNWGGKLGIKISDSQQVGVLVSNNVAKNVDFPALTMDLRSDNTWLINASHSAMFYDKNLSSWKTSIYGTFVDHVMDNLDKTLEPRTLNARTDATTNNYGGRSELRFDFEKSILYAGFDYRSESADGYRTRDILLGTMAGKTFTDNIWQDAHLQRGGIFGEWHLNQTGFQFVVSGRLDYNHVVANNPDPRFSAHYDNLKSSVLHPSISLGGTRFFNKSISLGIWLGAATRSPGITELYINQLPVGIDPYEMLGNPDLKPELNKQLDLVFQYQTNSTNLNVNVFSSILNDFISSEIREDIPPAMMTAPGVRQFVNIRNAFITGFEFGWNQQMGEHLGHDLSLVYTYGQNQTTEEALPEIPPMEFRYRLMGNFVKNTIKPEVSFRHSFKQDRIATSYGETKTPAFSVVDAKVSWHFKSYITATGGVQNLFDAAYYEHLARSIRSVETRPIYSPGRSFYLTLTFSFI
ncbi:MAG TPA: TonB-dependent receptor [Draconibacterium sp.]|nr:TonB-dependent receptor [Draconibacterium sp.]